MPAFPGHPQLFLVARLAHDVGDLVDVEACVRLLRLRAPLAFAVLRIQIRGDPGELFALFGIRRRGHDERNFKKVQFSPEVGSQFELVEFDGVLRKPCRGIDEALIGAGIQSRRVVGDVGLGNPSGLAAFDS